MVDLARGHVAAIKKLEEKPGLFICNLGTGHGYSVLDVIHAFSKACGKEIPYVIDPRRPGDIAECWCDPSKAKRELGWEAQYGIEEMCAHSWNWQSHNPDGYKTAEYPSRNNRQAQPKGCACFYIIQTFLRCGAAVWAPRGAVAAAARQAAGEMPTSRLKTRHRLVGPENPVRPAIISRLYWSVSSSVLTASMRNVGQVLAGGHPQRLLEGPHQMAFGHPQLLTQLFHPIQSHIVLPDGGQGLGHQGAVSGRAVSSALARAHSSP